MRLYRLNYSYCTMPSLIFSVLVRTRKVFVGRQRCCRRRRRRRVSGRIGRSDGCVTTYLAQTSDTFCTPRDDHKIAFAYKKNPNANEGSGPAEKRMGEGGKNCAHVVVFLSPAQAGHHPLGRKGWLVRLRRFFERVCINRAASAKSAFYWKRCFMHYGLVSVRDIFPLHLSRAVFFVVFVARTSLFCAKYGVSIKKNTHFYEKDNRSMFFFVLSLQLLAFETHTIQHSSLRAWIENDQLFTAFIRWLSSTVY